MSRRRPAPSRFCAEIIRHFGLITLGSSIAYTLDRRARLPLWGALALCLFGISTSGCLVTDQIDLPPRAQTPPILSSTTPMSGRLIRFDPALKELKLNIQIRDEDTTEVLRMRYRIVSGNNPPRIPTSPTELPYKCPEDPIVGIPGMIERAPIELSIDSGFVRGACHITNNEDNESDVGRASYWVWALSGSAVPDKDMAQALLESCNYDIYQPPVTTPPAVEK